MQNRLNKSPEFLFQQPHPSGCRIQADRAGGGRTGGVVHVAHQTPYGKLALAGGKAGLLTGHRLCLCTPVLAQEQPGAVTAG